MQIKGVVKWFRADKGFGFIKAGDREIFIHYSQIKGEGYKTLNKDDIVYFDLYETSPGKYEAKNLNK